MLTVLFFHSTWIFVTLIDLYSEEPKGFVLLIEAFCSSTICASLLKRSGLKIMSVFSAKNHSFLWMTWYFWRRTSDGSCCCSIFFLKRSEKMFQESIISGLFVVCIAVNNEIKYFWKFLLQKLSEICILNYSRFFWFVKFLKTFFKMRKPFAKANKLQSNAKRCKKVQKSLAFCISLVYKIYVYLIIHCKNDKICVPIGNDAQSKKKKTSAIQKRRVPNLTICDNVHLLNLLSFFWFCWKICDGVFDCTSSDLNSVYYRRTSDGRFVTCEIDKHFLSLNLHILWKSKNSLHLTTRSKPSSMVQVDAEKLSLVELLQIRSLLLLKVVFYLSPTNNQHSSKSKPWTIWNLCFSIWRQKNTNLKRLSSIQYLKSMTL